MPVPFLSHADQILWLTFQTFPVDISCSLKFLFLIMPRSPRTYGLVVHRLLCDVHLSAFVMKACFSVTRMTLMYTSILPTCCAEMSNSWKPRKWDARHPNENSDCNNMVPKGGFPNTTTRRVFHRTREWQRLHIDYLRKDKIAWWMHMSW